MRITAIKAQAKNPDRVSIYIDGIYSFSLSANQLLAHRLVVGLDLNESALVTLKTASEFGKLYERLLRYALLRPHSQYEVEAYCRRKQFDPEACAQVIDQLTARNYINDASFARSWIQSRQLTKTMSRRALQLELKRKGVSDDVITEAMMVQKYDEVSALQALVVKKKRQTKYHDRQKLVQYLARQGFSYDAIQHELDWEFE